VNPYLKHIPLGTSLPFDSPHAVSVSLPTMQDVIGYEENDPAVHSKMQSGYPRFFTNKLVAKLCKYVREKNNIADDFDILPLMSSVSLDIVQRKLECTFNFVEVLGCVFIIIEKNNVLLPAVKDFIRHTGMLLSSRKAEDTLLTLHLISEKHDETISQQQDATKVVKSNLCKAYDAEINENVLLCSSGMNAVYAVFEAIQQSTKRTIKNTIIQAGCLYLDSFEIIRKYSKKSILISIATDFAKLEAQIIKEHKTIAAVFTEVPNNPLLECADIPRIYELCKKYDISLIVDSTIGTAYNLNILPSCDIAVESLTKFACGNGDVMMGAILLNPRSSKADELKRHLLNTIVFPYNKDVTRLAYSIEGYKNRVPIISENTKKIIAYLEQSTAVKEIYSVLNKSSYENFLKIRKHSYSLPGVISVVFDKELAYYYDKLTIPKGPSLGTEFTLAMPYVYLAHYDLINTIDGRKKLQEIGLNPELLRISIGIEPVEDIIKVFKKAGI